MKLGTIGYGSIGKSMSEVFEDLGFTLSGFYDPNISGSIPLESVIENADVIHLASPTKYHLEQAKMVYASLKPCLFEKTFTATIDKLEEYEDFFFDNNWTVMVHFISPFMTNYDRVIDKVKSSNCDEVKSLSVYGGWGDLVSWKTNFEESSGPVVEVGSHGVYAAMDASNGDFSKVKSTEVTVDPSVGHDVYIGTDSLEKINDAANHFLTSAKHFADCLLEDKPFKVDRRIAFEAAKKALEFAK